MKNIYTILIFLLSIHLGYSQQKPEKYSLNSMADFSDFPVGNANGNPEIVVPLNKIKTQGNLDVNLMLQYNLYGSINAEMMGHVPPTPKCEMHDSTASMSVDNREARQVGERATLAAR